MVVSDVEVCTADNMYMLFFENQALGREGAVPLSNSLTVADKPRMERALRRDPQRFPLPFTQGHVIVSKVFLGRSFPIREGEPVDMSSYPKAYSVYRNVTMELGVKSHRDGPSQWFVFDHELVLPEYIVYFEYVTQGPPASPDLRTATDLPRSVDNTLLLDLLNTAPVLKPRPRMIGLDERTLLEVARANVLSQITVLNLHGNSLSKLKEISRLSALRHLTISFNEPNLEFVDASYNHIASLDGWKGLGKLKQLDLRWNKLTKAREETATLRKHAPALLRLDTRHNPWNRPDSVRRTIVGRLVTLTHLDDIPVTEEEVAAAAQITAGSRINQASLLANSRTDRECPRSLSLMSAAQLLCQLSSPPWPLHATPEPGWTARITALTLDGQRISRLANLDKLIHLRWASFNDNDISKVEGLENCLCLEELSLNHNCITNIDGLSKLHRLVKLSLNGNQLHCLDASALEQLPNLHFLSVENNCISSMHGIQRARALLELYIGYNHIATTRDIFHLKVLTNLIILELHGNPLVDKLENYRIYVVFQLPALKALDGVGVEVTESESAKDVFGGRLSTDMVAEKLGHSNYSDIRDLTMQACSIRTVDLSPTDLFLNLRSVNLENNNLTSFSGLVCLPNIKALCLNHNHIESILPRQKSQAHLTNRQLLYHKVNSSGYGRPWPSKGSRLTNLKALFLQGNDISQVEGLEGLTRLREWSLTRTGSKPWGKNSLVGQSVLLELHLAENRVRDLSNMEPLVQLRRLFLTRNKLQVRPYSVLVFFLISSSGIFCLALSALIQLLWRDEALASTLVSWMRPASSKSALFFPLIVFVCCV
ncbi:Leucine-rich repeat-containing protein 9 [Merluccius polli]|uniref:Leucine-rich repeat-containing protein 9 n=1 Tax=Merluccius polli TaxID=89951 RepID=A0AA47P0C9_MERPO|nr:Leucine-rich repeat-containing protein 9 [Merluccius polli]